MLTPSLYRSSDRSKSFEKNQQSKFLNNLCLSSTPVPYQDDTGAPAGFFAIYYPSKIALLHIKKKCTKKCTSHAYQSSRNTLVALTIINLGS